MSDFNTVFKGKERVISRRSTNLAGRYTVHNRAVEILNLREPLVGSLVFFSFWLFKAILRTLPKAQRTQGIEYFDTFNPKVIIGLGSNKKEGDF